MTEQYAGIILAGGFSSRMGRPKPLLPFGGETLLERQICLFHRAGVERVAVVTGHGGDALLPCISALGAAAVPNENYAQGMFTSVQAGVAALCREGMGRGFFILPIDYALVPPLALQLQMEAHEKTGSDAVFPSFNLRRGHPPLIGGHLAGDILAHDGSEGLNGVLKHITDVAYVTVWDDRVRMDADTPEDYEAALRFHGEHFLREDAPCDWLHETFCTGADVRAHCEAVARVAGALARAVAAHCPEIDPEAVRCAARVHDVKKGTPRHDEAGANLLEQMDYPGTGEMLRHHMGLPAGGAGMLTNTTLLYYADKITEGDTPLPLAERRARVAATGEKAAFASGRLDDAAEVESRIIEVLGEGRFAALMAEIMAGQAPAHRPGM